MLYCAVLCYAVLCCAMLCYAVLCRVISDANALLPLSGRASLLVVLLPVVPVIVAVSGWPIRVPTDRVFHSSLSHGCVTRRTSRPSWVVTGDVVMCVTLCWSRETYI